MRELFAQESAAVAKVEELSNRLGVTDAATRRFFEILGEQRLPVEQLPERLADIAARYKELLTRLEITGGADPEVQRLKERAHEALSAGDFDRTEELLNQAKARDLSAIKQMQAAIERMQADVITRKLSAAEAAAKNGDLMQLRFRYAEAAKYFAEAIQLTPASEESILADRELALATALWKAGDYTQAIAAAKRSLTMLERLTLDKSRLTECIGCLGLMLLDAGQYAEAEPLLERALAIPEKALGPEHPDVAGLNNLASLYHARPLRRGRAALPARARHPREGARPRAPRRRRSAQQPRPSSTRPRPLRRGRAALPSARSPSARRRSAPSTPTSPPRSTTSPCSMRHRAGTPRPSRSIERALAIREKALGPEHPDVATSLGNLAGL